MKEYIKEKWIKNRKNKGTILFIVCTQIVWKKAAGIINLLKRDPLGKTQNDELREGSDHPQNQQMCNKKT